MGSDKAILPKGLQHSPMAHFFSPFTLLGYILPTVQLLCWVFYSES